MVRSKPARLSNPPVEQRSEVRMAVGIAGRCRAGEREVQEVLITEVGARGCLLLGLSAGVTKSDPLALWLGEAGPFPARLKWAKRGLLGVEFDQPLDARVLETLADAASAPNVIPLRRGRTD
jgi:hypothetical protein